jgi:hypothetical protein
VSSPESNYSSNTTQRNRSTYKTDDEACLFLITTYAFILGGVIHTVLTPVLFKKLSMRDVVCRTGIDYYFVGFLNLAALPTRERKL